MAARGGRARAVAMLVVVAGVVVVVATLASVHPTAGKNEPLPHNAADATGPVLALYPRCDKGTAILHYLMTGDSGGDPGIEQTFATYVGVPQQQARALAGQWILACDQHLSELDASAVAAQAPASSETASSAAAASSSAVASASTATLAADEARSCESVGGRFNASGWVEACRSTVQGSPRGRPEVNCSLAILVYPITAGELAFAHENHPGCFP